MRCILGHESQIELFVIFVLKQVKGIGQQVISDEFDPLAMRSLFVLLFFRWCLRNRNQDCKVFFCFTIAPPHKESPLPQLIALSIQARELVE